MDGGSTENEEGESRSLAFLGGLEGWWTSSYMDTVLWSLVLCGSILLNFVLMVAFIRRPGLRTISNRFVMNLIVSNLLTICVLAGLQIAKSTDDSILTYGPDTPIFCGLFEGATALVTTSSILSVLVIGLDQYLAVVDPLRYRTRIDKLKCGFLIVALWFVALVFGILAGLNPQPRSFCQPREEFEIKIETGRLEIEESFTSFGPKATYGLAYALLYATLGYLVPFLAICWIYLKIYIAARSNSERTRRNGSRPILSTGSFSEDPAAAAPAASVEDFRRIPKISSLSSIDENSETCPSQMSAPPVPYPEEDKPPAVVFMVGSSNVDVSDNKDAKESSPKVVPISALKAKFLSENPGPGSRLGRRDSLDLVKSRFPEVAEQRRKSSHDLMYEEMMLGFSKHPYEYDDDYDFDDSSDEEEDEDDHRQPEAEPLSPSDPKSTVNSSSRSISVNFDLSDLNETKSQDPEAAATNHPLPIVMITPPGQKPVSATTATPTSTTTTTTSTSPPLHRVPSVKSTNSYINNLKYKISNGSLFKYREETRAARISALVIVMGLICWTPYVYVLVSRNLALPPCLTSGRKTPLDSYALGFLILATYISPLLFGYRSRRVKRELRKFFCFKRELSYKNNRSLMAKKVLRRRNSGATILGQFVGDSHHLDNNKSRYNIFNCMYGRNRWPKEKVQFVQVPDTALAVETCRSSFSSGASTQISSTSTDEC